MKSILMLLLCTQLYAETIHSSVVSYIEHKEFKNSVQKEAGEIYGFGADIHHEQSAYRFAYEYGYTRTKQPPLPEDLQTSKLFLKYSYDFQNDFKLNMNYIQVLHDNIAITDGGQAYGLGLTYQAKKNISTNFTQYYTHYDDFNVYQSDGSLDYKMKINGFKIKLSSLLKYIHIEEKQINGFTKNADDNYLAPGLKLHIHYNDYHFGSAVFFGKRVFAVMDDGFKLQHHAMEFDRTYAVGIGKNISNFVLRLQYIYSRAEELPVHNENVEISNVRVLLNYKF
jgi:opacity protein-like surface antigen